MGETFILDREERTLLFEALFYAWEKNKDDQKKADRITELADKLRVGEAYGNRGNR